MVFEELRKNDKIKVVPHPRENYAFYINEEHKTAVFSKCVSVISGKLFGRKKYKTSKNQFDKFKRCTTTDVGKCAIYYFMNNNLFADYSLVVNCATLSHEVCVFFSKKDEEMHAIYFNPNFSCTQDGIESSKIVNALLKSFGKSLTSIKAYYSANIESNCAAITWEQIYNHVWKGASPFKNNEFPLDDYSHCMTPFAYKKYWGKEKTTSSGERLKQWKDFDDILANVNDPKLLMDISNEISKAVQNYMQTKI